MNCSIINTLKLGRQLGRFRIKMFLNNKNLSICKYLFSIGLINSYNFNTKEHKLYLFFSSNYEKQPIKFVKQISKPGRKVYINYKKLSSMYVYKKYLLILSTNKGILSNKEALRQKIGGELLFIIRC